MSKSTTTLGLAFLLAVLITLPVAGRAQTRIDNPGRALAKNAGRVVELEEVLRIRDDGDMAIFKSPRFFKLGPDEQEADGLISIGKYRIPDADLFPARTSPKRSP